MFYDGDEGVQTNCGTISITAVTGLDADLDSDSNAAAEAAVAAIAEALSTDGSVLVGTIGEPQRDEITATSDAEATATTAATATATADATSMVCGMCYSGNDGFQTNSGTISITSTTSLEADIDVTAAAESIATATASSLVADNRYRRNIMDNQTTTEATAEATAEAVTAASATATITADVYGMYYKGNSGFQTNCGAISIVAATNLDADIDVITTTIATADAAATATNDLFSATNDFSNTTTATATATTTATATNTMTRADVYATAKTYGMFYEGDEGVQKNCGTISIIANTNLEADLDATATATATATSAATAKIILVFPSPLPTVNKDGTATATSTSSATSTADVAATFITEDYGMYYSGRGGNGIQTNCGTISVETNFSGALKATATNTSNPTATATATANAYGMYYEGDHGIQSNCGTISVAATIDFSADLTPSNGETRISFVNAYGMYYTGNDGVVTNCGEISVSGKGGEQNTVEAIHIEGERNTLNLLSGSRIKNEVVLDAGTLLNVGHNLNLVLTTTGKEPPVLGSIAGLYVGDGSKGNPLVVFDTTGFDLQSDVIVDIADAVFDGVSSGYSYCALRRCGLWGEAFGSYRTRSERASYHNEQAGLLVGYSLLSYEGVAGVFGGIVASRATIDGHTQEIELATSFFGVSYEKDLECAAFGIALTGGVSSWKNDRYVENNTVRKGVEIAHSEPDAVFFAAQVHVSRCFANTWGAPTLYGDVRYAGLYFGNYGEKGSAADFEVEERNLDSLTVRFVLEPNWQDTYSCWLLSPFVGIIGRHQPRGEDIEGKLNGQPFTFSQENNRHSLAGMIGVRASGVVNELQWSIRLEGTVDSESSSRFLFHFGADRNF
jgi:hypothetical protein